jgi:hypothetical protein
MSPGPDHQRVGEDLNHLPEQIRTGLRQLLSHPCGQLDKCLGNLTVYGVRGRRPNETGGAVASAHLGGVWPPDSPADDEQASSLVPADDGEIKPLHRGSALVRLSGRQQTRQHSYSYALEGLGNDRERQEFRGR